ncbi:DUF3093 domain-containing protein [Streptomyces sp. ST2-7A]|uniref:DUF3093 domain-containing protein n=1 Tax=Streptomyces sp. ST2-7A TaxID=2907214 RepID=UPI0027E30B5F|nr:DUF3093 domain-containing protein [Streptomyces sp. ST2-7A]
MESDANRPSRPPRPYEERLTVPRTWWLIALMGAALTGVTLVPLGPVPALIGTTAALVGCGMALSAYGSARIRVAGGTLLAGRARVPLSALGAARPLDEAEAVAWRTHRADARAFMLLRAYVPEAVRVEVVDPDDPTPYLYLSTRNPRRLVAALEAGRGSAPEAEGPRVEPMTGQAGTTGPAEPAERSEQRDAG